MPLIVCTATMRYCNLPDALDITRKTAGPLGRHFAPDWAMVSAFKSGRLSEGQFTHRYQDVLARVPHRAWKTILSRPSVTLVCYCPADTFCHRLLLAEELVRRGAVYKGEIKPRNLQNQSFDF